MRAAKESENPGDGVAHERLDESRTSLIAIVDDDESVRESLSSLVRSVGLKAAAFPSAEEFLQSAYPATADCLITDFRMAGMSGLDLQAALRRDGRRLPTILITAHYDESLRARALREGVVQVLAKPFAEHVILEAIQSALS